MSGWAGEIEEEKSPAISGRTDIEDPQESDEIKEATNWHRVVLWGKRAELADEYLKKGSPLHVEGELRNRSWTDKDGNKRYTTEVVAHRIQFVGKRERPAGDPPTVEEPPADQEPEVPADDIPF